MDEVLLQSKISVPPLRRPAVARARLLAELDDALVVGGKFSRRLTLISAPAGYGKTTVAIEWLVSLGYPAAWLSLDEGENDPSRFMSYLVRSIQAIRPGFGQAILSMGQAPQRPPAEVLLTLMLNELEAQPDVLILVLDDYHAINNLAIHQQVSFLLEHLPTHIHLVLISREDPLIPMARLRARNQVLEIRQDSLRFNLEEITDFMNRVMQLKLSGAEVLALERRTEGWIAGLQLVGITLHGLRDKASFIQEFTGSSRFILDYLMEEVVNLQPSDVRDFLLQTSILDRLCGPLCDAVTGRSGSDELLVKLEQSNMFIVPLDKSGTWYRYHHLFSELLRHQQQLSGQPSHTAVLHQKASLWFETAGYMPEAIQHALAAQDWPRAAQLIDNANESMFKHGEAVTLAGWLERLPEEFIFAQPGRCLTYAWALLLTEKYEQAGAVLAQTKKLAPDGSVFLGQVATAQAYLARSVNDNPGVIRASQQALALLPESDLVSRSNLFMNLGLVYWHEGHLDDAEQALSQALEKSRMCGNLIAQLTSELFLARTLASRGRLHEAEARLLAIIQKETRTPIIALVYFDLCTLYYEWDKLEKAELYLQSGLDICQRTGSVEFQIAGVILQSCLALARQDWSITTEAVNRACDLAHGLSQPVHKRCAAAQARVALRMDELNSTAQWLEIAGDIDAHPFYRFFGLIQPQYLIAQGNLDEASELLRKGYERASRAGWGYALVVVRVLQALAAGSPKDALQYMADALQMAEPEGYMRTFIDAGMGIIPLLREVIQKGIAIEYAGRILANMGTRQAPAKTKRSDLVEPLSEREIEVLRLVIAGLSNREIASKLVISPGTAKTHVHNLYGKLGVRNRIQAATRAKELGLD